MKMDQQWNKCGGKLPDRWIGFPRTGENLVNDIFFAFKTPLCSKFDSKIPEQERFHPEDVLKIAEEKNIHLGLWFDLTDTERYYLKEEVEEGGDVKYLKFKCKGKKFPDRKRTQNFVSIVSYFLEKHPDRNVAVHCTHGCNRTGFLIASYLIEKCGMDPLSAVQTFAACRPPGIYKEHFVNELKRRYENQDDNQEQQREKVLISEWQSENNLTIRLYS